MTSEIPRTESLLRCHEVTHRFGRTIALDSISVEFGTGITALLGPNGAGKSTILSIIATLRRPTSGSIAYGGQDCNSSDLTEYRSLIGYLPQRFELLRFASAHHNVAYAAWVRGLPKHQCSQAAMKALAIVGLEDRAGDRVSKLSGGQQQRVGLACAIVHQPKVVLLDEPTVGLDPEQRVELRSYLHSIAHDSVVVVSTHLLDDAAQTASRLVVLNEGRIAYDGTVQELRALGVESDTASQLESSYVSILRGSRSGR